MMAESCYDPMAAARLYVYLFMNRWTLLIEYRWARMEEAEKVSIPQFISTHPSVSSQLVLFEHQLLIGDRITTGSA